MKFNIQPATDADFFEFNHWWELSGEVKPDPGNYPKTTLVCYGDGVPAVSISMIFNNIKTLWLENFVANPEFPKEYRREATRRLQEFVEIFARQEGYKRLFCMAHREKLECYYKALGFNETCRDIVTLTKEL